MASLKDLYFGQIKDLYDAEKRLVKALPKMAGETESDELRSALEAHLGETEKQVERLEQIFSLHSMKPERKTCKAMKGLLEEGDKELKEWKDDPEVKDAAIIIACQRVEHYEISGYGSAKSFAEILGFNEDVEILDATLNEEKAADMKLNDVALAGVNRDALLADSEEDVSKSRAKDRKGSRPGARA